MQAHREAPVGESGSLNLAESRSHPKRQGLRKCRFGQSLSIKNKLQEWPIGVRPSTQMLIRRGGSQSYQSFRSRGTGSNTLVLLTRIWFFGYSDRWCQGFHRFYDCHKFRLKVAYV
jgi:hypothetical protein